MTIKSKKQQNKKKLMAKKNKREYLYYSDARSIVKHKNKSFKHQLFEQIND